MALASTIQLMELLYLVNIKDPPYSYFGYLNAMTASTFSFLPNLITLVLPSSITNGTDNAIHKPFS